MSRILAVTSIALALLFSVPTGIVSAAETLDQNSTPIGTHDAFEGLVGPGQCAAAGWAVDPDDRYADLSIRILADGALVAEGTANLFRQDLLDAGVSPDGISAFHINLWGVVSPNIAHAITAQALDAQTSVWVNLNLTPKELTCLGSLNSNAWILEATCSGLGDVTLRWLIGPTDAVRGSSAMQVVGSEVVVVIFTGGSEMIGARDGTTCTFTSVNGVPLDPPLIFFVVIAPRSP